MSATGVAHYTPEWLALREAADEAARAVELLDPLREFLARPGGGKPLVIRDLGCGTGSMGRWLAPRLDGPQHWILHDHDPGLLALAAGQLPRTAADGGAVTVATEHGDIARLTAAGLRGTSLVTASALLDLLTREELDGLVAACAGAGCPALLALSVLGRVDLTPADPMDAEIADAFNAHQRRTDRGRGLLGPDAVAAASVAFARHGMTVRAQSSPWRLGPVDRVGPTGTSEAAATGGAGSGPCGREAGDGAAAEHGGATTGGASRTRRARREEPQMCVPGLASAEGSGRRAPGPASSALTEQWLRGWVGAAREQRPELASRADAYLRRRLAACEAGELRVVVHHSDVLALPRPAGRTP
ncbi:SAM-dependent methyltransferase [Streptomyces sp. NPDC007861]|uniref:SAM-dependent methyltransferase n=1 Tax=Streptomyces sp. NPDC007861 TaxID=3154893 RepID=UPI0033C8D02D